MLRILIFLLLFPLLACSSLSFTRPWHPDPQTLPAGPASCLVPMQNAANLEQCWRCTVFGQYSVDWADLPAHEGRVWVLGLANPCVTGNLNQWALAVLTEHDTLISPLQAPDPRLDFLDRLGVDSTPEVEGQRRVNFSIQPDLKFRVCVSTPAGLIQKCRG